MSLKRSASDADLPQGMDGGDGGTIKFTDLPVEALKLISNLSFDLNSTNDLDSIIELANSSTSLFEAFKQWSCTCKKCNGIGLFTVDDGTGKLALRKDSDSKVTIFSCVTCRDVFCGAPTCTRNEKCNECDLLECWKCFAKHLEDCGMCCKFDSHCKGCKGECTKGCNLCGFSICDKHAKKCDTCGIQTCGIHDFNVDFCYDCKKGFCPRCHGHGDCMMWCEMCQKKSCMKGKCDKFNNQGGFCKECAWEHSSLGDY